ncbi:MAG: hypothetical protein CVU39_14170 [Chloroflexi bacterium HGW-Chloroflexi-10]|nr:MAG: hypothetical protein CVU39_14170 [Chloroflexi bacterium HGW-Chloroflexi-10]
MGKSGNFLLIVNLFFITILLSACSANPNQSVQSNEIEGIEEIDRTFREFYQNLGAESTLGPAITAIFDWKNLQCQYTENALMCFNPLATNVERFSLYPLGTAFDIQEGPSQIAPREGARIVNGHEIYSEFLPLYDSLYGATYAGMPITDVRFNTLEQRIEQYFENVGFYRRIDDPSGYVNLLAYGVYACDVHCRFKGKGTNAVIISENIELPFMPFLINLSDPASLGEPLTGAFAYENDQLQQVYQNAVIVGDPNQPQSIRLLDVPVRLGFPLISPGPQQYDQNNQMVFYNVDGPNGYHVPIVFDQFIANHGGRDFSGNPLSEVFMEGDIARQCFHNYCLDYVPNAPEGQKVRMASLGEQYLKSLGLSPDMVATFQFSPNSVNMQINEKAPTVGPGEEQILELVLLRSKNKTPIADVEADLQLTLPDGSQRTFNFPPTDTYGHSNLILQANPTVESGTLIAYKACLNVPSSEPICVMDNYLIWQYK